MGIGNTENLAHACLTVRLITPHGDWKLAIRKGVKVGDVVSLPLMGIGNWGTHSRCIAPLRPHYPSWGLETTGTSGRSRPPDSTHYPSWGLET